MSIRVRLALWYGALLVVVLAAAVVATNTTHRDLHLGEVDESLRRVWDAAASARAGGVPLSSFVLPLQLDVDPHMEGLSLLHLDGEGGRVLSAGGVERGPGLAAAVVGSDGPSSIAVGGVTVRVLSARMSDGTLLVAAASLAYLDEPLKRFREGLSAIVAVGTAVALVGGWAIAGSALRPIAVLGDAARAIAGSRAFSRRVPAIDRHDELGALARTFNEMLASLEEAYRLQQQFVSETSHELRTPLTTVHGNAELLAQDDIGPAERSEAVAQILRETRRLKRLVEDLLVLANADAGAEPFDAARVELDEVLMQVFDELRPQAGGRLRVVALDEAPVAGERDRLKQLVLILLDNALRYTPSGGCVEASVSVDGGDVVLRVDDTGIGLDADAAAHAFDRYFRGEAARQLAPGGTGLGLAIARWIVERHGGSVRLERREPVGTRAVARFPLTRSTAATDSARARDRLTST